MTIKRKGWDEFRSSGLLWWVNRTLHLFGWVIVFELDQDSGEISEVYPARTKFRGFSAAAETDGFKTLGGWVADHANEIRDCSDGEVGDLG